jgi:hypothetical protein
MGAVARSTTIFLTAGLVGPLIRWVVPVTPTGSDIRPSIGDFVYNLVLLLWPAQPLAVIEVNTGKLVAAIMSVGANLLLFGLVGVVAGFCARKPGGLGLIYLTVCAMVVALALWAFGRPFTSAEASALASSLVLYAFLFIVVFRLHRTASR